MFIQPYTPRACIFKSFFPDLEKNGILPTSISFESEAEVKNSFPMKNVPPVKKKMLWKQKKKSYQQQSIPFQNDPVIEEVEDIKFNEEELDVPKTERLFKSKFKEKRKSKSLSCEALKPHHPTSLKTDEMNTS